MPAGSLPAVTGSLAAGPFHAIGHSTDEPSRRCPILMTVGPMPERARRRRAILVVLLVLGRLAPGGRSVATPRPLPLSRVLGSY